MVRFLLRTAVFLASGYYALVKATRDADLSLVAPFRYSGLLLALLTALACIVILKLPAQRLSGSGRLTLSGVHSPVPADLYHFAGPRSYTGQDVAELHTVGSPPLVERLVADLLAAGARPARPYSAISTAPRSTHRWRPTGPARAATLDPPLTLEPARPRHAGEHRAPALHDVINGEGRPAIYRPPIPTS